MMKEKHDMTQLWEGYDTAMEDHAMDHGRVLHYQNNSWQKGYLLAMRKIQIAKYGKRAINPETIIRIRWDDKEYIF